MGITSQDVITTKVNFDFQVVGDNKKVYAGLFRKFAEDISDDHPELASEFDTLGKALGGRKKRTTAAKKKATAKKTTKKKKKPVRMVESETYTETDDSE